MRRLLRAIFTLALALPLAVLAMVAAYSHIDPPVTALMLWRLPAGHGIDWKPVPVASIAPALSTAVLASEDNRFCTHHGIDWREVEIAIGEADARGGAPRGASTITMQTARNLFLWPHRSYVRKALEVPIALAIDLIWTKRRLIEVYLNIVEWGPGIYGAEAAARHHFARSASDLTPRQAALLAASLPAPLVRRAARPSPALNRIANRVERRVRQTAGLFDCIAQD